MKKEKLQDYITTIPDFPKEGIMFRDITTLVKDPDGLNMAIRQLCECIKDVDFDLVLGLESRGFFFAPIIAYEMKKGFIPVRKEGKLPRETLSCSYDLEYGEEVIEIHKDAINKGDKVVIVDDLIATGGTLEATCKMVEALGGQIEKIVVVTELMGLNGRDKLAGYDFQSLIKYPGK